MKPQQRCQPLKIAMCKSLNYTHTILPNFLNHTSQAVVSRILNTKEFKSQLKSNCSTQLKRFVCFLFAPFCTSDGTPLPPCQRFCEKVKTDCANLTARWLADLDCARFPTLSRKRLCLGDPLTTIDCVGPHSRPCTGSAFFFIVCSFFVACPITSSCVLWILLFLSVGCIVTVVSSYLLSMLTSLLYVSLAPKLWNQLPLAIRQSNSVDSFKRDLKTYLFFESSFF